MTLIVGWLACDQRGPCAAYIASDSRVSNGANRYDYSQKLFALKNTADILGYCGEVMFTNQTLSRLVSLFDEGKALSPEMDFQNRSKIIYHEIAKQHKLYLLNQSVIKIYHIGRNNKKLFEVNKFVFNGVKWECQSIKTDYNKSSLLFSDGSGQEEYYRRFDEFQSGNNENTSRNCFHCFCDILSTIEDKHTGGMPQLVGIYNGIKFNGMYHGIIIDGHAYYQGLETEDSYIPSDVRWYNEKFEICNLNTKKREVGAMIQPISKR